MLTRRPYWTWLALMLLATGFAMRGVAGPPAGKGNKQPSLSLSLASSSIEEMQTTTGTVTLNNAEVSTSITVTLASSDPTVATVEPVSVSLSDTSPSAAFSVAGQSGAGDRLVTITATSDTGLSASADLTVSDGSPGPAVRYELTIFSTPSDYTGGTLAFDEMNDLGEGVGHYRPYVSQSNPGASYQAFYLNIHAPELNEMGQPMVTNLNDIELDPNYDLPFDPIDPKVWYIARAYGINNSGLIVRALEVVGDSSVRRGFVLELRPEATEPNPKPRLHLLPDQDRGWTYTYPAAINDYGEILGVGDEDTPYFYRPGVGPGSGLFVLPFAFHAYYDAHLNNPVPGVHDTQILWLDYNAAEIVLCTIGGLDSPDPYDPQILPLDVTALGIVYLLQGLHDADHFCGSRNYKKSSQRHYGFVYDGQITDLPEVEWSEDINNHKDVLGTTSGREPILYHAQQGMLALNALAIHQNAADQQIWNDGTKNWDGITERRVLMGDPDYPIVFGSVRCYDMDSYYYQPYVLFPLSTPQLPE